MRLIRDGDTIYVMERCVFRPGMEGLELVEIAPGVDLKKDVLDHMDFTPLMHQPQRLMDSRIFRLQAIPQAGYGDRRSSRKPSPGSPGLQA